MLNPSEVEAEQKRKELREQSNLIDGYESHFNECNYELSN